MSWLELSDACMLAWEQTAMQVSAYQAPMPNSNAAVFAPNPAFENAKKIPASTQSISLSHSTHAG